MCKNVDTKLALFLLDELDISQHTIFLVSARKFGWDRLSARFLPMEDSTYPTRLRHNGDQLKR